MSVNLESYLERFAGEDGKERQTLDIRIALDRYPSLVGYWFGSELLMCSSEINEFADKIRIERVDSTGRIVALPYIEDLQVNLYTNPVVFYVARDNPNGFGVLPYKDWKVHFEKSNVSRKLVRAVEDYLSQRQPANYW